MNNVIHVAFNRPPDFEEWKQSELAEMAGSKYIYDLTSERSQEEMDLIMDFMEDVVITISCLSQRMDSFMARAKDIEEKYS